MTLPRLAAQRAMVRDLLGKVPGRIRHRLSGFDFASLAMNLSWTEATPQCDSVPIPNFSHRGRSYVLPSRHGENLTCLEYAIADEYYKAFTDGDAGALALLVATLCREEDPDAEAALRRGDKRVPLHDKAEIVARAERLRDAPHEMQLQALLYFGGMKTYMHRVYGKWLFEQPEEEEEDSGIEASKKPRGPDFGWWGMLQQVAEGRVFGNIKDVYQASLHEVCVYLVRKRLQEEQAQTAYQKPPADPEE